MAKKLSRRANFIATVDLKKLAEYAWDAMQLASSHDPDHAFTLESFEDRISVLERQMERIGAPQYRIKKLKNGAVIYIQRVRGLKPGDCKPNVE
jgi:hypothetical protein